MTDEQMRDLAKGKTMAGNVRLICNTDSDELMVHWPNGTVEFVGVWGMLKLCWWIVRNGKTATIVDAKTGLESDA